MKFRIRFLGYEGYAIDRVASTYEIGLDHVDKARAEFGSDLSLDIFDSNIAAFRTNIGVDVPEDLARETGLFAKTDPVYIGCVPVPGYLNDFVDIVPIAEADEETGTIRKISFKYVIKEQEILKKWKNDDYVLSYYK